MTHRVCSDSFVSLQTNLFNSTYAFSKKDDFFYKEHEPYGVKQKGVHSILLRIHNVWPCWQSFHHGVAHFVCCPLLVDETVTSVYASFLEEQFWNFVLF